MPTTTALPLSFILRKTEPHAAKHSNTPTISGNPLSVSAQPMVVDHNQSATQPMSITDDNCPKVSIANGHKPVFHIKYLRAWMISCFICARYAGEPSHVLTFRSVFPQAKYSPLLSLAKLGGQELILKSASILIHGASRNKVFDRKEENKGWTRHGVRLR